jgi:hypothetical protein
MPFNGILGHQLRNRELHKMSYDTELAAKGKMRTQELEVIQLKSGKVAHVYREVIVSIPKVIKAPVAVKAKRIRGKATGTTKLDLAREIYKKVAGVSSRKEIIQMFQLELSMTQSGATTYFYNVKK